MVQELRISQQLRDDGLKRLHNIPCWKKPTKNGLDNLDIYVSANLPATDFIWFLSWKKKLRLTARKGQVIFVDKELDIEIIFFSNCQNLEFVMTVWFNQYALVMRSTQYRPSIDISLGKNASFAILSLILACLHLNELFPSHTNCRQFTFCLLNYCWQINSFKKRKSRNQ